MGRYSCYNFKYLRFIHVRALYDNPEDRMNINDIRTISEAHI